MKTRDILILVLGATAGVIADRLFGKPASVRSIKTEDTTENKFYTNGEWADDYEYIREMNLWNRNSAANYHNFEKSLADTQPIRVDEVGKGVDLFEKLNAMNNIEDVKFNAVWAAIREINSIIGRHPNKQSETDETGAWDLDEWNKESE
jgi:hypothetical protein